MATKAAKAKRQQKTLTPPTKSPPETSPTRQYEEPIGPPAPEPFSDEPPAIETTCRKCGSNRATDPLWSRELAYGGIRSDGSHYSHVRWERKQCLDCGQVRVDRITLNMPDTVASVPV
ncbi:hypothetical protein [Stratiformator vulcanicus]|uniref:Uncharacterized protein n=1 Tax=Stratiformator vulcanicus TaxID=2527980 RepID=A0A517R774_9PLAN|nr:hypothetical protein [Stratiformator vulcanicus]QDT39735.1 hypothetical protein Pan189_41440 [Stratiformator vulcanicus]